MTDTVKVKKWSYPFKLGSAEATDPQQYYAALAKAKDGYYPLGGNGLWHGGVHFDEATGLVSEHSEVRCIADGQVIAYRIDEAYPVTAYADRQAVASTGFVLVKHQLEVPAPPAPATPAGATPAPTPAGGPTLTFYSLYMHLVDMAGYNATPALARPTYWSGGTFRVKADVTDKIQGLNVRAAAKGSEGYDQILTTLPRGTTVVTGEASTDGKWLKIVSVSPAVSGLAEGTGWVYKNEMTSQGNGQYLIGEQAKDTPAGAAKGLNVRSTAAASGSVISVLPAGTELTISEAGASGKYRKLAQIISGTPMPALTADTSGNVPGYVWLPSLEAKSEPKAMGSVVVLDTPVTINAGATIGYAGKYQSHDEGAPRNLVHIEVFSCEDVQAFVTASRSKAAALPADQKNLLHIYKNTNLITHRADISATNPPKVSDPHVVVGYDLIIPVSVLEAMPAEKKIKDTSQSTTAPTLWWHIEGLLGDAQGNPISGWLREQDIMTPRHNPWEWEGFDFIEETGSNADHLAAYLHALDAMTDEEKTTYASNVSASISGPAKSRLYEIIDTDHDNKLTSTEIRAALAKPWFAQSISQLVTKYESEWLYKADKWDALDALMGHTAAQPNVNWVAEKKRIEGLAWGGALGGKEGIGGDGNCWHVHTAAMVANFDQKKRCTCNVKVQVTRWIVSPTTTYYGPTVWGEGKLGDASQWATVEAAGLVTAREKRIITVMCENEGKINAVQSYDSEIITAGAMQKTINPQNAGELPAQVSRFKDLYPDEYIDLFESQGWHVETVSDTPTMYYQDYEFGGGAKLQGQQLKDMLRQGCSEGSYGSTIQCKPVSSMACAIASPSYVELQIKDFIQRLKEVLLKKPNSYDFTVEQLFRGDLGRATALDEFVNRPNNVVKSLKKALDKFFVDNPTVSKNIETWGSAHTTYEREITENYGHGRSGMTEPVARYNKIKASLNA